MRFGSKLRSKCWLRQFRLYSSLLLSAIVRFMRKLRRLNNSMRRRTISTATNAEPEKSRVCRCRHDGTSVALESYASDTVRVLRCIRHRPNRRRTVSVKGTVDSSHSRVYGSASWTMINISDGVIT